MTDQAIRQDFVSLADMAKRLNVCEKTARVATRLPGFPQRDRLFGKWWWPEVTAFLNTRHGINVAVPVHDGEENFHAKAPAAQHRRRPRHRLAPAR